MGLPGDLMSLVAQFKPNIGGSLKQSFEQAQKGEGGNIFQPTDSPVSGPPPEQSQGLTNTIQGLWQQWRSRNMAHGSGMDREWHPQAEPGVASRQFGFGGVGD